jgi:type I restriction enzyme S subunit
VSLQTFFDNFALLADAPNGVLELREIILQFAVQGKLLSHDKSDLSAFGLAKEIKAARTRANKNRKGKANGSLFPVEFEEPPFEISSNWCWISIGEAMNLINGRAFKPSDWSSTGIPIVRIQNLNNPDAPFNYCDFEVDEKFFINDTDLLISWSGTPGTSFGAFIWDRGHAVLNQHIFRAELYGKGYDKPFLRLAINARLDEMIAQAHGAVGLQHITKGKLENLLIPLPPLEEQKRIVAKVDELMRLCDKLEVWQQARRASRVRLNNATLAPLNNAAPLAPDEFEQAAERLADNFAALYDSAETVGKLRSTILQLAVQGKLVPQDPRDERAERLLKSLMEQKRNKIEGSSNVPGLLEPIEDDEKPFRLPSSWGWARLDDIVSIKHGFAFSSEWFTNATTPFVMTTPGNFYEKGGFRNRGLKTKYYKGPIHQEFIFSAGDLIIPMTEQAPGLLGSPAFIPDDGQTYLHNQRLGKLVFYSEAIEPEFVFWFFNSAFFRSELAKTCTGMKVRHTSPKRILRVPFPVCSLAEQRRIVAKVNQLMALCDELETKLRQAEAESEKLMKAAVRDLLASIAGNEKSQRETALALSSV